MHCLIVILFLCLNQIIIVKCEEIDLRNRTLIALSNVFDFVFENLQQMNVDGIFGITLATANLEAISMDHDIFDLINKGRAIIEIARPKFKNLNRTYQMFNDHLLHPSIWKPSKKIHFSRLKAYDSLGKNFNKSYRSFLRYLTGNKCFNASFSDQCLWELIYASTQSQHCYISHECERIMVNSNHYRSCAGYGISHRLLLLQAAEVLNCSLNNNEVAKRIEDYCSLMLFDCEQIAQFGFIDALDDLFMEQITLCGHEGFAEFFNEEWLQYVLSIQKESGCFAQPMKQLRIRREANIIIDDCNDHTTGLGAAVLAVYLRFLSAK